MANPVAIYSADPAAPAARGGTATAQVIQIDVYRSGANARGFANAAAEDAVFEEAPQQRTRPGATSAAGGARAWAASATRGSARPTTSTASQDDDAPEVGRRRAPASLSFAAQLIAQEGLSPGLHFENYTPAVAAYTAAAQRGLTPTTGQALELSA